MNKYLALVGIIIGLMAFAPLREGLDPQPKFLLKDLNKLFGLEDTQLSPFHIPDSLYDKLLLDNGQYFHFTSKDSVKGYVYITRVFSCRAGGCSSGQDNEEYASISDEDSEYFDYYIAFGLDMEIRKVKVYNYQATHGQEVCGVGWLKQFIGYNGDEKLSYGKDIDALSGATISANAITYNVQEASRYLQIITKGQKQEQIASDSMAIK